MSVRADDAGLQSQGWDRAALQMLVDPDDGRQDARVYTDNDVYERELSNIFGRCWLCLGHESQLVNKGDYFTSYMGEDAIIVTRHRDGSIHAMLNQCRHRGTKLCRRARRAGFVGDYYAEDKPRMLWRIRKALSGKDDIGQHQEMAVRP